VKILGLELRKAKPPPAGASGRDADSRLADTWGDYSDPNWVWNGPQRWVTIDEMRKTDATVKSTLWMIYLVVRSARWSSEPASTDPLDKLVDWACRKQFGLGDEEGQLDQSWGASVQQALLSVPLGSMFEEIVYDDPTVWRDADGDEHPIIPIARLAPRYPSTIKRVNRDPKGRITSIEQNLTKTSPIPAEKLAYYCLEPDPGHAYTGGGGWYGTSALRAAWLPWKLKKEIMIITGIAWDRYGGGGTPFIWRPSGAGAAGERKAREMARDFRTHEHGYLSAEGPAGKPGSAVDGWWVELLTAAIEDPVTFLRWASEQISGNLMQQFAALGTTLQGARSVGEVLERPYYLMLETLARDVIARERRRQVLRRFVDVNFGEHVATPKITVSRIRELPVDDMAKVISDLDAAGYNFADRGAQNDMRDRLGFDHLPEDMGIEPVVPREGDGLPDPAAA
jgi:hypothetical protein